MKPFSNYIQTTLKPTDDKRLRPIGEDWVGIVIHHTGISDKDPTLVSSSIWKQLNENIARWIQKRDETSAHFLIGRYGELTQFADPRYDIAYHAGRSSYYHPRKRMQLDSWNKFSIGIELLGDGNKGDYSAEQYNTLIVLCIELMREFPSIDPRCIVGHENVSPSRKVDPGIYFNWHRLFQGIYTNKLQGEEKQS